jgi:hypothetical protein
MSQYDPPPGPMDKLMIAACLAVIAVLTTASVVGMTGALDRLHHANQPTACEAAPEFCDEVAQ